MKLLINDTTSIQPEYAESWLDWVQQIALPIIKKESCIESFRLTKIQGSDDENGITYALQFILASEKDQQFFLKEFDPKFQQEQLNRFRGHFGSFRSVLEVLDEVT